MDNLISILAVINFSLPIDYTGNILLTQTGIEICHRYMMRDFHCHYKPSSGFSGQNSIAKLPLKHVALQATIFHQKGFHAFKISPPHTSCQEKIIFTPIH